MAEKIEKLESPDAVARMQKLLDELKGVHAQELKSLDNDADDEDIPTEDQPKSLKEARIRVREHFRSRRTASPE